MDPPARDDATPPSGDLLRDLVVAVALALAAGSIDAIAFRGPFGVFPANQSGNLALLGIDLGRGLEWWRSAAAIGGFVVGILAAVQCTRRIPDRWRATGLLALEAGLLLPVLAAVPSLTTAASDLVVGVLLALAAVAMGVQTEVVRSVAGTAVATTDPPGAIAHVAESVGGRDDTLPRRVALGVLAVVIGAYVAGAFIGTAAGTSGGAGFAGGLVLAALAIVTLRR